jgi:hypothetical protein
MTNLILGSLGLNGRTATESIRPCLVWRNPEISPRTRQKTCRRAAPHAQNYEVLEKREDGFWYVVAVFTVIDRVRP